MFASYKLNNFFLFPALKISALTFRCVPDNSLLSERSPNEAFCLVEAGEQFAVYFIDGGSVDLDMGGAPGEFSSLASVTPLQHLLPANGQ